MFISFLIPSVFEGVRARHLCVLYKQLGALGRDQVAFVGEPAYFESPSALERAGRAEWHTSWCDAYDYRPPTTLDGVVHQALPEDLFTRRLQRLGSSWKLYGQLLTRRLPELEAAFSRAVDALPSDASFEAVLVFANNPSVSQVARRLGLPVVHNEFGPLRKPGYVSTAYWDLRGVNRTSDAARRYRRFRRETAGRRPPWLTREEILHTLRRAPLPDTEDGARPRYRVGVALQGDDNTYVHGTGPLDLLSLARQQYSAAEVLVRYHAGSQARYVEALGVPDRSRTATEFIQQCDTVLTVSSGTALEALLLGRRAVVVGDSPFALAADRRFEAASRRAATEQLRVLNFLVFGYLVPGDLMFDPEYVRWRLTDPSEVAIYRHHQRWHREHLLASAPADPPAVGLAAAAKLLDAVPPAGAPLPLVVFGGGAATLPLVASLRPERFAVQGIFDNDPGKWGSRLAGATIGPPHYRPDVWVVMASLTHADAMAQQLSGLGYLGDRILRLR